MGKQGFIMDWDAMLSSFPSMSAKEIIKLFKAKGVMYPCPRTETTVKIQRLTPHRQKVMDDARKWIDFRFKKKLRDEFEEKQRSYFSNIQTIDGEIKHEVFLMPNPDGWKTVEDEYGNSHAVQD